MGMTVSLVESSAGAAGSGLLSGLGGVDLATNYVMRERDLLNYMLTIFVISSYLLYGGPTSEHYFIINK